MKGTKIYEISCPLSIMDMPNCFTELEIAKALEEYFGCQFGIKEITKLLKTPLKEKPQSPTNRQFCTCEKPIDDNSWREHMTTETPVCITCHLPIRQPSCQSKPPKQMKRIGKLKGRFCTNKEMTIDTITDKINELIDYVNDLEKLDDDWVSEHR